MTADWPAMSRAAGFDVGKDRVTVPLGARRQVVRVKPDARGITLWSTVASARTVDAAREAVMDRIGKQNMLSELIGYRVDGRGRLIGETCVPIEGLDADEWKFYVTRIAQECDRLEFLLTGDDRA